MTTFPALLPSTRTFSPGSYPQSQYLAMSGLQTLVGHSTAMISSQLRLTFIGLSESEKNAISAHYHGQQGSFLPFVVPSEIFSGFPEIAIGTGAGQIIPCTFSQSSTYFDNTPATFAGMTNGVYTEDTETGTNDEPESWIQMDLGSVQAVATVVVGCDFDSVLQGGWSPFYTANKDVEGSTDGTTWTTLFNTGNFDQGIQSYNVDASVRYIRIIGSGYLCATEFYATRRSPFSDYLWHYVEPPQVEDFCGPHFDVSVNLATVPPEGVTTTGITQGVRVTLEAGTASGNLGVGIDLTVTATLAAGGATAS